MKKILWIISILLFLFSVPVFALTPFEDESWIGAYIYKKNLTDKEKYQPFILVRDGNYLISQPGSAVRTILADYILTQDFLLIKDLNVNLKTSIDSSTIMNEIDYWFSTCETYNKYQTYMYELKALLLLKTEVKNKKDLLQLYLGGEFYNKFYYDFYHLQLVRTEMPVPNNQHWANSKVAFKNPVTQKIIQDIQASYLMGSYSTKIEVRDGAIDDSVRAAERLNTLIPIYPTAIQNSTSPLISEQLIPLDNDTKRTYLANFSNKIHFEWINRVQLLTFTCDKSYVETIMNYFNLFDDSLITIMNDKYKSKFGQVDTSMFNKSNLTSLLQSKLGN